MTSPYRFEPVTPADRERVADWVSSDTWPFHVNAAPPRERVLGWFDEGAYMSDETQSWWMILDGEPIGLLSIDELEDSSPSLDLRLRAAARGQGHGLAALRWMTAHAFATWPRFQRLEGCTREDNAAMRRTFERAGYAKEGHIRAAWPVPGGVPADSVRYGILRTDFEQGKVTPVRWDA